MAICQALDDGIKKTVGSGELRDKLKVVSRCIGVKKAGQGVAGLGGPSFDDTWSLCEAVFNLVFHPSFSCFGTRNPCQHGEKGNLSVQTTIADLFVVSLAVVI